MRIFVASGIFHPDSGGPATYLYRLLPALQAHGHEIRALAYGNAPSDGYPYPLTRIRFEALPIRMAKYARAYRQGAAWADMIYLNSLDLPRTGNKNKCRVMKIVGDRAWERCVNQGWIPAAEDIDQFQAKQYGPLVEYFKAKRCREVQTVDRIIVPSDYLRRMVIGWGADPSRVCVIYNALENDGDKAITLTQAEVRDQLGWRHDDRIIVTAARLTAWKGVDLLIDALARVPGITLVVAGGGPQDSALRSRAADLGITDRVLFLGKVPHDKMMMLYRAADYLVLYSGYEGLSHTLLEALSAGTPVLASNRGGNPEIVRDGENGLLIPHPHPDALVDALQRAFGGDTPQRLAAGTSHGLERFSWPRLVEQTLAALTG